MIVSWNWLNELVPLKITPAELVERLMMAGLNHEGTEPLGNDFALDLEGQILRVRARVCRTESAGPGDGFQVGVEFVELDPAHERLLRGYLG